MQLTNSEKQKRFFKKTRNIDLIEEKKKIKDEKKKKKRETLNRL